MSQRSVSSLPSKHVASPKRIGAHVSISKGIHSAIPEATHVGGTAFALFTRSPRTWKSKTLSAKDISRWEELISTPIPVEGQEKPYQYTKEFILPHGSYLANLGCPDEEQRERGYQLFRGELELCQQLGIGMLNIHPGSTRKEISVEQCVQYIAENINKAMKEVPDVHVILENTAGGGGTVGVTFEELRDIIELVTDKSRVGVCLDTCHMFAAGYDIQTSPQFDSVMDKFDDVVGMDYLRAMHLNDSQAPLGSKRDRHEKLGQGLIGLEAFWCIMNDSRFDAIPMILETPGDSQEEEIRLLYSLEGMQSPPSDQSDSQSTEISGE